MSTSNSPIQIPPSESVRHTTPSIGVALGGGGARGLAHIPMLEAFDELGIRPKVIAGTSIGAIYGAAYASGISGKELRAHTELVLSQRFGLVRDLFAARAQPFQRVMNLFAARSALLCLALRCVGAMPCRRWHASSMSKWHGIAGSQLLKTTT